MTFHDSVVPWCSDSASEFHEAEEAAYFRAKRALVWDALARRGRREDDGDG